MRVYLLPEEGQFYKANMHSHSTLSDGHITPSELKEIYKKKGYSVYAFTEHAHLHDLREQLDDKNFITIPSYEIAFKRNYKTTPFPAIYDGPSPTPTHAETIHMNLFWIDPEKQPQEIEYADLYEDYSVENINTVIRRAKEAGYFVSYNHPHWSLNTGSLYNHLEGLDALEIINGAAYRSSGLDHVPHVYREMAWNGKRLVCIAGDDNHRFHHFFWAWTMIKAPELSHKAVMDALQAGNCYASAGPEIKELYVEDGVVHITTSEAQAIYYSVAGRRKIAALSSENNGEPITHAEFKIDKNDIFFHLMVKDMQGKPANTRIFYLDEADFGIQSEE